MWLCMWKLTISEEILILFLDYFNIFALCEQFWKKMNFRSPFTSKRVSFGSPFCQKLCPLFTIFGSPCNWGTVGWFHWFMRRCLIVSTFWEDDGFDFNKHHNPFCHRILGGGRSDGSIETLLDVIYIKINAYLMKSTKYTT